MVDDPPRIYVACLASYNNGRLHGAWLDAHQSIDELRAEVQAILARSPEPCAEEWAIHDHEGFRGIELGEYESLERIAAIADFVVEHRALGARVLEHAADLDDARRMLAEDYQGAWSSLGDWAESFLDDTAQLEGLRESLRAYFDYEAFGRDAELGGDILTVDGGDGRVHVFWAR